MKYKKFKNIVISLIFLSPLGVILPEIIKNSGTWGEWDNKEIINLIGYLPQGIKKYSLTWNSIFPEYSFSSSNNNLMLTSLEYLASAIIGTCFCFLLSYFLLNIIKNTAK